MPEVRQRRAPGPEALPRVRGAFTLSGREPAHGRTPGRDRRADAEPQAGRGSLGAALRDDVALVPEIGVVRQGAAVVARRHRSARADHRKWLRSGIHRSPDGQRRGRMAGDLQGRGEDREEGLLAVRPRPAQVPARAVGLDRHRGRQGRLQEVRDRGGRADRLTVSRKSRRASRRTARPGKRSPSCSRRQGQVLYLYARPDLRDRFDHAFERLQGAGYAVVPLAPDAAATRRPARRRSGRGVAQLRCHGRARYGRSSDRQGHRRGRQELSKAGGGPRDQAAALRGL